MLIIKLTIARSWLAWRYRNADVIDSDAGRLAGSTIQRHVDDVTVVGALLRRTDDVWQLRSVQSARRHLG